MSDANEGRSGDVVVSRLPGILPWRVQVNDLHQIIDNKIFGDDPQAIADFIDSQQPKPRYYVGQYDAAELSAIPEVLDRQAERSIATCTYVEDAERIARLLNADEADQ